MTLTRSSRHKVPGFRVAEGVQRVCCPDVNRSVCNRRSCPDLFIEIVEGENFPVPIRLQHRDFAALADHEDLAVGCDRRRVVLLDRLLASTRLQDLSSPRIERRDDAARLHHVKDVTVEEWRGNVRVSLLDAPGDIRGGHVAFAAWPDRSQPMTRRTGVADDIVFRAVRDAIAIGIHPSEVFRDIRIRADFVELNSSVTVGVVLLSPSSNGGNTGSSPPGALTYTISRPTTGTPFGKYPTWPTHHRRAPCTQRVRIQCVRAEHKYLRLTGYGREDDRGRETFDWVRALDLPSHLAVAHIHSNDVGTRPLVTDHHERVRRRERVRRPCRRSW